VKGFRAALAVCVLMLVIACGATGGDTPGPPAVQSSRGDAGAPYIPQVQPGSTSQIPEVAGRPQVSESGLRYIDVAPGSGATPRAGQTVNIHYTAWIEGTGQKLESSDDRGTPLAFRLGGGEAIRGLEEGVSTMRVGGKRRLIIPASLAYGSAGTATVPPDTRLVYDVELVGVE
jgi:FKBP-type peptidyl-prolyl cis-trans isomerase